MTKKIRTFIKRIERALEENAPDTDWKKLEAEMLTKIGFFQHERLVHLIVTMTVGVVCVMSILAVFIADAASVQMLVLIGLFLVLLVPYMVHYYNLENGVQELYQQYDKVREKAEGNR